MWRGFLITGRDANINRNQLSGCFIQHCALRVLSSSRIYDSVSTDGKGRSRILPQLLFFYHHIAPLPLLLETRIPDFSVKGFRIDFPRTNEGLQLDASLLGHPYMGMLFSITCLHANNGQLLGCFIQIPLFAPCILILRNVHRTTRDSTP